MMSEQDQKQKISDNRDPGYFMIDNEICDNYQLSCEADSLYMELCRWGNTSRHAWPALREWMKRKGIGWDKVKKGREELVRRKLIEVFKPASPNHPADFRILPVIKDEKYFKSRSQGGNERVSEAETRDKGRVSEAETRQKSRVSTVETDKERVNKSIKKEKRPTGSVFDLGSRWCSFLQVETDGQVNVKFSELSGKDKKALKGLVEIGVSIDDLRKLSRAAKETWSKNRFNLAYLLSDRVTLLAQKVSGRKSVSDYKPLSGVKS